jgi:phospholipid/cholesterol/gamma-HCH transport system substrate-binding protein
MSATSWKLYAVTGAVVASSLALLAALTFSLSQSSWKRGSRWVEIDFPDATGIRPHGPVRYAGALAGEVVHIRFLTAEERLAQSRTENAVRVTVRLQDDVPALPVGVLATLSSESVMGEKFIALAAGSPDAPELANGSIIQGEAMVTFDQVAKSAVDVTENLNTVLARLTVDYGQLVSEIHDVLGQGGAVLGDGR